MNIPDYIQHAPLILEGTAKTWIDAFLAELSEESVMFEIGSGTGRDAEYIEQKGYKVVRTDIRQEFIDYQKRTYGKEVYAYDILKDDLDPSLPQKYDAILVRSVLNHFSIEEILKIFERLNRRLNNAGLIAFNITKEFDIGSIKALLNNMEYSLIYEKAFEEEAWAYFIYKAISVK